MQKGAKKTKVAIIYGWAEGPWQGRSFNRELKKHGLEITTDIRRADVVIGHSLGCYLIPENARSKLVLLISLPYWPNRSVFYSLTQKLKSEMVHHRRSKSLGWWTNKMIHNTWYILCRPQLSYYVLGRWPVDHLPDGASSRVIVVRPTDDTFCHPEVMSLVEKARNYKYI